MKNLNVAIMDIPIPRRMERLPISSKGFPVPWFVAFVNGDWDFRVIGPDKIVSAVKRKLCWLCGQPLGVHQVFTIGPMCTINRISAEPPSHIDCAEYAVKACPFLSKPNMRRNEKDMPPEGKNPAGIMLKRNPGLTALWVTRTHRVERHGEGALFHLGTPEHILWFAEGRMARDAEIRESIRTGLPHLEKLALEDGPEGVAALADALAESKTLLPPGVLPHDGCRR